MSQNQFKNQNVEHGVQEELREETTERKTEVQREVVQKKEEEHQEDGELIQSIPQSSDDDDTIHLIQDDKSKLLQDIERVLEEDLALLYGTLNEKQRVQFRVEGEKTAAKIETLLKKAKITLMEVIKLIRKWLVLIPGVNIFFIEKEAKIKAEKILMLRKEEEEW